MGSSQTYDSTLHYKVAGTVIMALIVVFAIRAAGFRFVVTVGAGR